MKKSAIIRIVIYSLLTLVLVSLLGTALALHAGVKSAWNLVQREDLSFQEVLDLDDDIEEKLEEKLDEAVEEDDDWENDGGKAHYMEAQQGKTVNVPAEGISSIEIQWVSGDLTVVPGDVEEIILEETETDQPMIYSVHNGKLVVKFSQKLGKKFNFGFADKMDAKNLTITVPQAWAGEELEIQSVSADVEVRDLQLQEIEYQGVSGKCNLENCKVGEMSVQTVSGNETISGQVGELECESVSADCDLTLTNVPGRSPWRVSPAAYS